MVFMMLPAALILNILELRKRTGGWVAILGIALAVAFVVVVIAVPIVALCSE
jgi:hypothetical protein